MNTITHPQDIDGTEAGYLTTEAMDALAEELEHAHGQQILDEVFAAHQYQSERSRAVFAARHALFMALEAEAKAQRSYKEAVTRAVDYGHSRTVVARYGRLSQRRLQALLSAQ